MLFISLSIFLLSVLIISFVAPLRVEAAGWLDEATDVVANYADQPLFNYSLDFFVEDEGSSIWKPWTWGESLGNSALYAIYLITNIFWLIGATLSWLSGYVMEQAFNLDFISDAVGLISKNIQKLAGVNQNGFMSSGLFPSLAGLLILIMGVYLLYVGMFKRENSKALSQAVKFIILFVFGMGFIAYSSGYIGMINDFQQEMNDEVMDIGASLTLTEKTNKASGDLKVGEDEEPSSSIRMSDDSVVNMRQTLFDIQVRKPYLLLQYGESDESKLTTDRINLVLDHSPYDVKEDDDKESEAEKREKAVKKEVTNEKTANQNMSISMVGVRLGMVFLTLIINIVITICIFIFSGVLIFSQVLFIMFVYFLPVAIIFGLLPGRGSVIVSAFSKAFNAIMTKVGITILLTVVFSISNMIYSLSANMNYFWMAFLQIVVFVVSVLKMNEFFGFMHLSSSDSEKMTSKAGHMGRHAITGMAGYLGMRSLFNRNRQGSTPAPGSSGGVGQQHRAVPSSAQVSPVINGQNKRTKNRTRDREKRFTAERMGATYAKTRNVPGNIKQGMKQKQEEVKDLPLNTRVKAKHMKESAKRKTSEAKTNFFVGASKEETRSAQQAKKKEVLTKKRREQNRMYLQESKKKEQPKTPPIRDVRNTQTLNKEQQNKYRRKAKNSDSFVHHSRINNKERAHDEKY